MGKRAKQIRNTKNHTTQVGKILRENPALYHVTYHEIMWKGHEIGIITSVEVISRAVISGVRSVLVAKNLSRIFEEYGVYVDYRMLFEPPKKRG